MIYRLRVRRVPLQCHQRIRDAGLIAVSQFDAPLVPLIEILQADTHDRALNTFKPHVVPDDFMIITDAASLVLIDIHLVDVFLRIRHNASALAERVQVLAGVKAVAADISKTADFYAFIGGAGRLRAVFHNIQAVPVRDFLHCGKIERLPVKMHTDNCFRPWCDFRFYQGRINLPGICRTVDKDRHRTCIRHPPGRRDIGICGYNDFVSGSDSEAEHRKMQRRSSVVDAARSPNAKIIREFAVELIRIFAARKRGIFTALRDRVQILLSVPVKIPFQINSFQHCHFLFCLLPRMSFEADGFSADNSVPSSSR